MTIYDTVRISGIIAYVFLALATLTGYLKFKNKMKWHKITGILAFAVATIHWILIIVIRRFF
jgi:hypothetical protein